MDFAYHFPPELLQLLVDAIPRLNRSKPDVILFFRGAGVNRDTYKDLELQLKADPKSINKFHIARTVLTRLNEGGDSALASRREVLKRVVELEDFSACWPGDRLEAMGLVAQIRELVGKKDAFTRMRMEREETLREHRAAKKTELDERRKKKEELEQIRQALHGLFALEDPQRRGRQLEGVLNRWFAAAGILVRESFARVGTQGEGVVEQIDGVIELDGHLYLVEMKWLSEPVGVPDVSHHLVRVFSREATRGIFISYSEYTPAAISTCREALGRMVVTLCTLHELVMLLDRGGDLRDFLKAKVQTAVLGKEPYGAVNV